MVRRIEDEALLEALATLRENDQEILRLKAWEEMSNEDIATTLGIKVRAVEMRVNRSRKRLAGAYKRLGQVTPIPTSPRFVEEGGER